MRASLLARLARSIAVAALPMALGACLLFTEFSGISDGDRSATDASVDADQSAPGIDGSPSTPSSYQAAVLADRPVGYWRFEENAASEPARDEVGGNHGVYVGKVVLGQAGVAREGSAVRLGDGETKITVANVFDFAGQPFSVEAWIVADAADLGQYRGIAVKAGDDGAGQRQGWAFWVYGGLRFELNRDGTFYNTNAPYAAGTPAHVVATSDGTKGRIYVNGRLEKEDPAQLLEPNPAQVTFGARFVGLLDELALYDQALTEAQVRAHYDAGRR